MNLRMQMIRVEWILWILLLCLPNFSGFVRQNLCCNGWISAYSHKSRIVHKDKFVTDPEEIRQLMDMLDIPTEEEYSASEVMYKAMVDIDNHLPLTINELEQKWKTYAKKMRHKEKTIVWKDFLPHLFKHESQFLVFPEGIPHSSESGILTSTVYVTETELRRLWDAEKKSESEWAEVEFDLKESLLYLTDDEDSPLVPPPPDTEEDESENIIPSFQSYRKIKEASMKHIRGTKRESEESEMNSQEMDMNENDVIYIPELELRRIWAETANGSAWGLPQQDFDITSSLLLVEDSRKDIDEYVINNAKELPIEVLRQYYFLPGIADVLEEKERKHPSYNSTLTRYEDPRLKKFFLKYVNESRLAELQNYYQLGAKEENIFRAGEFGSYSQNQGAADMVLLEDLRKDFISETWTQSIFDHIPDNRYQMDPFRGQGNSREHNKLLKEILNYNASDDPTVPIADESPLWERLELPIGDKYPFTIDFLYHFYGPDYDYRKVAHLFEDAKGENLYYTANNVSVLVQAHEAKILQTDGYVSTISQMINKNTMTKEAEEENLEDTDTEENEENEENFSNIDWETFDFDNVEKEKEKEVIKKEQQQKVVKNTKIPFHSVPIPTTIIPDETITDAEKGFVKRSKYKMHRPNVWAYFDEWYEDVVAWDDEIMKYTRGSKENAVAESVDAFFEKNFADKLSEYTPEADQFNAEDGQLIDEIESKNNRPKGLDDILELPPEVLGVLPAIPKRKTSEPFQPIDTDEDGNVNYYHDISLPPHLQRDACADLKAKNRYYHWDVEFPDEPMTRDDVYYELAFAFYVRLVRDSYDDIIGDQMVIEDYISTRNYFDTLIEHSPPAYQSDEQRANGVDPSEMPWWSEEEGTTVEFVKTDQPQEKKKTTRKKKSIPSRIKPRPFATFANYYKGKKEQEELARKDDPISQRTPIIHQVPAEPLDEATENFIEKEFQTAMRYFNTRSDAEYDPLLPQKQRQEWILNLEKVHEANCQNTTTQYLNIPYIAVHALPEETIDPVIRHMNNFSFIDMIFNNDLKFRNLTELFANNPSAPPLSSFRYYTPTKTEVDYFYSQKFPNVTYPIYQAVLPHYLPDLYMNVNYTNEVIEMKNKISLLAHSQHPPEESIDIGYNTDLIAINKIGTVREMYDWYPDAKYKPYLIEVAKVDRIQALLDYLNTCAELKSTKDDIFLFDYYGPLKHIIGMMATCLQIATECYPQTKDVRFETHRDLDPDDINGIPVNFL